jgi:transposase-like protein
MKRERGYLSTIARRLGLHPKSLYQLHRTWEAEGIGEHLPQPVVELPDGKRLYDVERYMRWYDRHVQDMGRKGRAS